MWTDALDEALAIEVITWTPYAFKARTKSKTDAWKGIADALKENYSHDVSPRSCMDRYKIIKGAYVKKMRAETAASGKNSFFQGHREGGSQGQNINFLGLT